MSYVAIVVRRIYGTSGTELPPRVREQQTYGILSADGETEDQFKKRISELVLPIRRSAEAAPCSSYSARDGWDWAIHEIRDIATTAVLP